MLKVNLAEVNIDTFSSPQGTCQLQRREISHRLREKDEKDRKSAFEIEHIILPAGEKTSLIINMPLGENFISL